MQSRECIAYMSNLVVHLCSSYHAGVDLTDSGNSSIPSSDEPSILLKISIGLPTGLVLFFGIFAIIAVVLSCLTFWRYSEFVANAVANIIRKGYHSIGMTAWAMQR